MLANPDRPPPDEEIYRRPDYVPEPPPTPAVLFGQLAFTLAVFVLIAILSVWHRPPSCDGTQGQTARACIQNDVAAKSSPDLVPHK